MCVLLLATLVTLVTPEPAQAYPFGWYGPPVSNTGEICPGGFGLTRKIVPCVKETIIQGVNLFLVPFSAALASTINAVCVLSIAVAGMWVTSGRIKAATRDMVILAVKLIFVTIMTWNFGGFFGMMLDVMEDLLGLAGVYALSMSSLSNNANCPAFSGAMLSLMVWEQVDCAIEILIGGIFSPFTLAAGIAGFLMSALISTTVGAFIALMGFYIVIQLIYALAKAVYTFVSAYVAFAVMVLISPLFIPCILFKVTKPYFDKWLRLTVSFILQPMIVFAYLSMLMVAVDMTVFVGPNSVYRVLAGNAVDSYGFELGSYLMGVGAYGQEPMMAQTIGLDPNKIINEIGMQGTADTGAAGEVGNFASQTFGDWTSSLYQWMGLGSGGSELRFYKVDWPTTAVDWNWLAFIDGTLQWTNGQPDPTIFMIKLITSFFMAAVVAYIFLNMLDSLPFLSAGIAGVPAGMPTLGHGQLAPPGSNLMETFKTKISSLSQGGR